MPTHRTARVSWVVLAVAIVLAGLMLLDLGTAYQAASVIGLSLAAALGAVVAGVRSTGWLRAAWFMVGAGLTLNTLGDSWYQYLLHRTGELADLSIADVFYLASYPCLVAGLGVMAWILSGPRVMATIVDSLAIVVVAGLAIWQFFVVNTGLLEDEHTLKVVVFAAYPMADVFLVGAVVGLLFSIRRPSSAMLLVVAFTGLLLGADIFYNLIELVGAEGLAPASDALYCLAYGALAAAGVHPAAVRLVAERRDETENEASKVRLTLLGATVFAALALSVAVPALGYEYNPIAYLLGAVAVGLMVVGRIGSLVGQLVHEHRRLTHAETRLVHQAEHDSLTQLPNRAKLLARIDEELGNPPVGAERLYVMFVDLDNFKFVNDSFGHRVGDELLQQAGARIRGAVRDENFVARLGGDEFVIVARSDGDVAEFAERVIHVLSAPYRLHGLIAHAGASVGIATYDEHADAGALLRDADLALYRAKGDGGGCARLFDAGMGEWAQERHDIEAGLRTALADGGLAVAYQPLIDLATGAMTSVEALLRWPSRPEIPVARLIEVAEMSGLIPAVGRLVLHRACSDIAALNATRPHASPIAVAVNVSMLQLSQHDLEADTREALALSDLPAELLTLELTETFLADDPVTAKRTLDALSALGVRLEIDDFGVGYSSLARLAQFPLHGLKIDRSFIGALREDPTARSLVESIVSLARALDLEVTAEGIERPDQASVIRDVGCDNGQGFLFGRPMSFEDLVLFSPVLVATPR